MPRVVKRSASQTVKSDPSRRGVPLPRFVPPQLSQPVEKPPSGPQWLHEIKLDGYRMAARIDNGRAQLLTRTGLDWTAKYPSAIAALANLNVKTAYLDGELCGVDEAGLPSFAHTQAATDGESGARLVYYAFDLLHLDGRDVSRLPLLERKALLEPLSAGKPGLQFNGHETGDGDKRQAGADTAQRPATSPQSRLSGRSVRDRGLFDVIVIERFTKRPRFRDFPIALLQIIVLGVVTKPGFPRLGLNVIGSGAAKFFISLQNIWDFVRISSLKKHCQSNAIFNGLIGPLTEVGEHRVGGVA